MMNRFVRDGYHRRLWEVIRADDHSLVAFVNSFRVLRRARSLYVILVNLSTLIVSGLTILIGRNCIVFTWLEDGLLHWPVFDPLFSNASVSGTPCYISKLLLHHRVNESEGIAPATADICHGTLRKDMWFTLAVMVKVLLLLCLVCCPKLLLVILEELMSCYLEVSAWCPLVMHYHCGGSTSSSCNLFNWLLSTTVYAFESWYAVVKLLNRSWVKFNTWTLRVMKLVTKTTQSLEDCCLLYGLGFERYISLVTETVSIIFLSLR